MSHIPKVTLGGFPAGTEQMIPDASVQNDRIPVWFATAGTAVTA